MINVCFSDLRSILWVKLIMCICCVYRVMVRKDRLSWGGLVNILRLIIMSVLGIRNWLMELRKNGVNRLSKIMCVAMLRRIRLKRCLHLINMGFLGTLIIWQFIAQSKIYKLMLHKLSKVYKKFNNLNNRKHNKSRNRVL